MRKFLIAGNWKMNAGPVEAKSLAGEIITWAGDNSFESEVVICPPYVSIPFVAKEFRNTKCKVGAQNVHTEDNGAFTGEISTSMLKELECEFVIVGHSERREYFDESDELISKKTLKSLTDGLKPIVCVGEKLDERKSDSHKKVVKYQVEAALNGVSVNQAAHIVIAYEPVWAIGTGETASPEQAQEMHLFIRSLLEEKWNKEVSESIRILYGGSMKPGNAKELLSQPDVDGGLIGGASLDSESFTEIISISESISK